MPEYFRTTHECTLSNFNQVISEAIREHIQKYELDDVESSVLLCCETTSTKTKKGLFGRKPEVIQTGMLLTPQWLIWATMKDDKLQGVLSARLRDIQVQDYEKSDMYKIVQDTGINVSGMRTDAISVGTTFIGLGSEAAAQKFRTMLKEAITRV